jgi:hypothetical protein
LLLRNASGHYDTLTLHGVGAGLVAIATADLDQNGTPDLVTANAGSNDVSVLLGDGAGGLLPEVRHAVGAEPVALALLDMNGDSWPEVVVANAASDDLSVLTNGGSGRSYWARRCASASLLSGW